MNILFALLFFIPLYGCDSSFTYEQVSCFSPSSSSSTSLPSGHFGITISNDKKHTVVLELSAYKGMFPDIDALYKNGHVEELIRQHDKIGLWNRAFDRNLALKKSYIHDLLEGENRVYLDHLARIAAIDSPRRMRIKLGEVYNSTKDPLKRSQALILADKKTRGYFVAGSYRYMPRIIAIPSTNVPVEQLTTKTADQLIFSQRDFLGELRDQVEWVPLVKELVSVEFAKYEIERLLPLRGTEITPAITKMFMNELFCVMTRFPHEHQQDLLLCGIEEFMTRTADVKGTVLDHKRKIMIVSEEMYKAANSICFGDMNYLPSRTNKMMLDLSSDLYNCSQEDLARAAGKRVAGAAYDGIRALQAKTTSVRSIEAFAKKESVTHTTIQPGLVQEHDIFCDVSVTPEIVTDFCSQGASKIINISPEVDAQVQHRLSQLSEQERQSLDQLSDSVGAILFEMRQSGELTPAHQATLTENLQALHSCVSKITREDIPYFCARSAIAFKHRISDPVGIVTDQVKGVYAVSKFFCDMYFGQYYMSEQQQLEHFENSLKTFTETIDGLQHITVDQVADLTGMVAADLSFNFGAAKAVTYLREIGVASKFSNQFNRVASSLEKQFVQTSKQVVTTEGTLLNCPKELGTESAVLKNASNAIESSSSSVVVNNTQHITITDILSTAKVERSIGWPKIYRKQGGAELAKAEFNSVNPTSVLSKPHAYGEVLVGDLGHNTKVIYRNVSSDGTPTLEFRTNGKSTKVRYD